MLNQQSQCLSWPKQTQINCQPVEIPQKCHKVSDPFQVSPENPQTFVQSKDVRSFIEEIIKQLQDNQKIYEQFLDLKELIPILNYSTSLYVSHQSAAQIFNLILDFLSYVKNYARPQSNLTTTFSSQYPTSFAARWKKIKSQVYFYNKNHLKLLSYIVKEPQSAVSQYGSCFQNLKFDLSEEECLKVAEVVKEMSKEDLRAFCFLSNYLVNSCFVLEKQGNSTKQIENKYQQILKILCKIHKPAPTIEAPQDELNLHKSFKKEELIPSQYVDLNFFSNQQEKQLALNFLIMDRAEEALLHLQTFTTMMQSICQKNGGFHFKAGVKIKSKAQTKALTRIKQKMLANIYNEVQLQQQLSVSQLRNKDQSAGMIQTAKQEYSIYLQKMNKIFDTLKEPVQFGVADMLRGKCMFVSLFKINNCCSEIIAALQSQKDNNIRLIEIDNRLQKRTSDLVLKILFGDILAELQLVIQLNTYQNQFNHKLYELQRSKFFTPLTQLLILNEQISTDYLLQVHSVIEINKHNPYTNFEQSTNFQQASTHFPNFLSSLSLKINLSEKHNNQIDFSIMKSEQQRLKRIKEVKIPAVPLKKGYLIYLDKGRFYVAMEHYSSALQNFNKANQQLQDLKDILQWSFLKSNYCDPTYQNIQQYQQPFIKQLIIQPILPFAQACLQYQIAVAHMHSHNFTTAIEYFEAFLNQAQQINNPAMRQQIRQRVIQAFNQQGVCYYELGRLNEAMKCFDICINIELPKNKTKETYLNWTTIYLNIGLLYSKQKHYEKAMICYTLCLMIHDKYQEKANYIIANAYQKIGVIQAQQGHYQQAAQSYQKCLEISEKVYGKYNHQTASVMNFLGSLHLDYCKFIEALQCFSKSLQIMQRIHGKGNIKTADSLKGMGLAYSYLKDYDQAISYLEQCLSIELNSSGELSQRVAITYNYLGLIQNARGDHQKALKYLLASLEIKIHFYGKNNINIASTLSDIGLICRKRGEFQFAVQFCKWSLDIYTKFGLRNGQYAAALKEMGLVLHYLKQYETSAIYLTHAIDIYNELGLVERAKDVQNTLNFCLQDQYSTLMKQIHSELENNQK